MSAMDDARRALTKPDEYGWCEVRSDYLSKLIVVAEAAQRYEHAGTYHELVESRKALSAIIDRLTSDDGAKS